VILGCSGAHYISENSTYKGNCYFSFNLGAGSFIRFNHICDYSTCERASHKKLGPLEADGFTAPTPVVDSIKYTIQHSCFVILQG
jgi:hypothetical protein